MNLTDEITEIFKETIEKQNPWMPYRGDAGGQGWQNMVTGEVRYQDARPDPGEGMPDDHEDEIPTPEEEPPDELDSNAPDWGEVDVDEGEEIEIKGVDGPEEVTIVDTEPPKGEFEVQHPDGDTFLIGEGEILTDPLEMEVVEEPLEGWADGWTDAPDEFTDLEHGQTVEIYDLEAGEYAVGNVTEIEEDNPSFEGDYLAVSNDEGEIFESVPGMDAGDEIIVTAQENLSSQTDEWTEIGEPSELDHGDTIHVKPGGNEATVDNFYDLFGGEHGEYMELEVTSEEDEYVNVRAGNGEEGMLHENHFEEEEFEIFEGPMDLADPSDVPLIDPENPDESDWSILNGSEMEIETPMGEMDGELDFVRTDPEGFEWFSIGGKDGIEVGNQEIEIGEEITLVKDPATPGADPSTYEGVFQGEYNGIATGKFLLETENGTEIGFDPEDVDPESVETPEEQTLTTNPAHPLYIGNSVQSVEQPFSETTEHDEYKIGDKLVDEHGTVHEVEGVNPEKGEARISGPSGSSWYGLDEVAHEFDEAMLQEPLDTPDESYDDEWRTPFEVTDMGDVDLKPIAEGSYVYYHDEESGEMTIGQATEFADGAEIPLENGETVHRAHTQGFAHDEMQNVTDPTDVDVGDVVSATVDGGEVEGTVASVGGMGSGKITLITEDGEQHQINPSYPSEAITEHQPDPDDGLFSPSAFEMDETGHIIDERPTEEVTEDILGQIDLSDRDIDNEHRLSKYDLNKQQKKELQYAMYEQFGVETVDEFYSMKSSWKTNSGDSRKAETLERAYKEAMGINAPHRDNRGQGPSPNLVKMAETVASVSQEYFREVFGESEELARGASSVAMGSFFEQFLTDPQREEYNLQFLANNNHTTDFRGTADKWGTVTFQHTVEPEDVITMSDHLFETSYESELEIGVHGDNQTVSIDGVHPGHQSPNARDWGLEKGIENWNSTQAEKFWYSTGSASSEINYGSLSSSQLQNLKRLVDHTDKQSGELTGAAKNALEEARTELIDNGMPPEADDASQAVEVDDFDGLGEVTGWEMGEGVPVKYKDPYSGEAVDGEIMGVEGGEIGVWSDDGDGVPSEMFVDTDDLVEVDRDELEELQGQVDLPSGEDMMEQYSSSIDDFDQLDDVYYTHGGDVKQGTVLDASGDTVEISGPHGGSEYFGEDEVQGGMVVPEDVVDGSDESEDDGYTVDDVQDAYTVGEPVVFETLNGEAVELGGYSGDGNVFYEDPESGMSDEISEEYVADNVVSIGDPDDFGAIVGGFDSIEQIDEMIDSGNTKVEYIDLNGNVHEGEVTGTFSSVGAVHISGEKEAISYEHVRPAEGSDDSNLGLDDYGLMENEGITFDTEDGSAAGYAEYVNSDGTITVSTPELNEDTVTVDPDDIHEGIEDPSEGSTEGDEESSPLVAPEDVSSMDFSSGETFQMQTPLGPEEVAVLDPGIGDEPLHAQSEESAIEYLIWDSGEVEEL